MLKGDRYRIGVAVRDFGARIRIAFIYRIGCGIIEKASGDLV